MFAILFLVIVGAVWYGFHVHGQAKRTRFITAFRDELRALWPAYAHQITDGVAASVLKLSVENPNFKKIAKLEKQINRMPDGMLPFTDMCAKTQSLANTMFDYEGQLLSGIVPLLPAEIQADLRARHVNDQTNILMGAMVKAGAFASV